MGRERTTSINQNINTWQSRPAPDAHPKNRIITFGIVFHGCARVFVQMLQKNILDCPSIQWQAIFALHDTTAQCFS